MSFRTYVYEVSIISLNVNNGIKCLYNYKSLSTKWMHTFILLQHLYLFSSSFSSPFEVSPYLSVFVQFQVLLLPAFVSFFFFFFSTFNSFNDTVDTSNVVSPVLPTLNFLFLCDSNSEPFCPTFPSPSPFVL